MSGFDPQRSLVKRAAPCATLPDDAGIWLFHCHVSNQFVGGMAACYQALAAKE